jgi:HSP20 family molecular chaperone IbpA
MFCPASYFTSKSLLAAPHRDDLVNKKKKDFYFGKHGFAAQIELHDFKAEEIRVKTVGNHIIVTCEHSERSDSYSSISRSFSRKFFLPDNFDLNSVASSYKDGVLSLTCDRRAPNEEKIVLIKEVQ